MQSLSEEAQTCMFCNEQPATENYTRAGRTLMVCATCRDRLEVQEAYEYKLVDTILPLKRNEQYDEALACLVELLRENRHRDHDQWLARSIARDRAMILLDAGRYAETEQACKAWAEVGFGEVWDRWMHASVKAETLDELGRTREGLAVLEEALGHRDPPRDVSSAWGYLEDLAEISEKLGQPVDPKWQSLAEDVAKSYGVEMPKHESLGKSILELAKSIRRKDPTYREYNEEEGEDSDDDGDDDDDP